jgi:hypothetical protein
MMRSAADASRQDLRIAADLGHVIVCFRTAAKTIVVAPDQQREAQAADQPTDVGGIDAGVAQRHRGRC